MRALVLALSLTVFVTSAAHAGGGNAQCEEPNAMIVLDFSGSMNEFNKWGQAVNAINRLAAIFERTLRLGLMLFPWNGRCTVERNQAVLVSCWPNNAAAIQGNLAGIRPANSNRTPIGRGIEQATAYFRELADPGRRSFMILITDGIETCGGNARNAASNAFGQEIPVFVIGFGNGVDGNELNRIAQNGGTGSAYRVDNEVELLGALEQIADAAREEICDGQDNDCDGRIDEGLGEFPCTTQCGNGVQICVDGQLSICFGGDIPEEDCDGIDNDCDGEIDELVILPCETLSGNVGFRECVNGIPAEDCTPEDPTREEICDGIDNDMDGQIDEGTDQLCTVDCNEGRRLCVNGAYLGCTAPPRSEEICNGRDDDCDGLTDEMGGCVTGEFCGEEGICLRPCVDGECEGGFFCDTDDFCHPFPCDPPCADGQVCLEQVCYTECVLDRDCPEGTICENGYCEVGQREMPTGGTGGVGGTGGAAGGTGGVGGSAGAIPSPTGGTPSQQSPDATETTGCRCDAHQSSVGVDGLIGLLMLGLMGVRRRRRLSP